MSEPVEAPRPDVPLIRNAAFQLLWVSRFVAGIGKEAADVAYPLLILATTGSAALAGAVGATEIAVAGLVAIIGGNLADRVDRRTLLLICDAARVIMLALFGTLVATHHADDPVVFAVVVGAGFFLGISDPPAVAAIKHLVPASQLTRATTQSQIRPLGATVVGSPLGSSLFGVASALPFLATALSFVVSSALLLFIKKPMQAVRTVHGRPRGTGEGLRFLVRQPVLLSWMIWIMGSNMAFNHVGAFLALIATARERHASGSEIGLMLGIAGSGGLIGAALATWAIRRLAPSAIFMIAAWSGPVAAVLLTFVPGTVSLGVILAAVFVRGPAVNALFFAYIAVLVPDRLQGQVIGAVTAVAYIAQPVGILGVGAIFDAGGPRWVFAVIGVVSALAALPTLGRHIRRLPAPDDLAEGPAPA
ncbi:MFS transporter [Streptacidiphilus sp. N1-12]|uniref:Multidrug efflux pump Tap n=2 Tax=Streptacidiphilus alkalitolerans TaxID=3342712 RepID=A0ABV6WDZ7_9ACTN